jgi:hypothetical protein
VKWWRASITGGLALVGGVVVQQHWNRTPECPKTQRVVAALSADPIFWSWPRAVAGDLPVEVSKVYDSDSVDTCLSASSVLVSGGHGFSGQWRIGGLAVDGQLTDVVSVATGADPSGGSVPVDLHGVRAAFLGSCSVLGHAQAVEFDPSLLEATIGGIGKDVELVCGYANDIFPLALGTAGVLTRFPPEHQVTSVGDAFLVASASVYVPRILPACWLNRGQTQLNQEPPKTLAAYLTRAVNRTSIAGGTDRIARYVKWTCGPEPTIPTKKDTADIYPCEAAPDSRPGKMIKAGWDAVKAKLGRLPLSLRDVKPYVFEIYEAELNGLEWKKIPSGEFGVLFFWLVGGDPIVSIKKDPGPGIPSGDVQPAYPALFWGNEDASGSLQERYVDTGAPLLAEAAALANRPPTIDLRGGVVVGAHRGWVLVPEGPTVLVPVVQGTVSTRVGTGGEALTMSIQQRGQIRTLSQRELLSAVSDLR